jgi:hypothetical protein
MAERSWYIANAGTQEGPYSEAQLLNLIAAGQVNADTLVWTDGMAAWQRAGDIPGLMASGHGVPSRPLPGGASWPDVHPGGAAVTADFGVWALLGRILLAGIGLVLVVPAPWAMTSYYRWFIAHLQVPTIPGLGFAGQPGDIWWVFVLTGLLTYAGAPHAHHHVHNLRFLVLIIEPALSWLIIRWVVENLTSEGQPLAASFAGSVWGFIGWNLLLYLSFITIIGWAWVTTAFLRWVCRNVTQATRTVSFDASGWQVLWRTIVFVLAAIFIIPIPWMLHWYVRWYVSQFSVAEKAA